jgi:Flp pilus assembly protein TadD
MTKSGAVSAIQNRGLVHLKAGELDLAIKDYNEAFLLLPNNAEVLYGRGIAKQKNGDAAGAFPDISRAQSLNPDIVEKFAAFGVK